MRLVEGGQSIVAAARLLGVVEQTLFNWVKAKKIGKLKGVRADRILAHPADPILTRGWTPTA